MLDDTKDVLGYEIAEQSHLIENAHINEWFSL